jgi:hypothetical protein
MGFESKPLDVYELGKQRVYADVRKMRFESKPLGVCVLGKDAIVAGRHAVQQVYNFRQFLLLEPQ